MEKRSKCTRASSERSPLTTWTFTNTTASTAVCGELRTNNVNNSKNTKDRLSRQKYTTKLYIHGFSHLVGSLLKVGRQKEIESLTAAERKCNKGLEFISFPSSSSSFYHRCRRRVHVSVGRSQPPFFIIPAFSLHTLSLRPSSCSVKVLLWNPLNLCYSPPLFEV